MKTFLVLVYLDSKIFQKFSHKNQNLMSYKMTVDRFTVADNGVEQILTYVGISF